jgi:hypothetical protein
MKDSSTFFVSSSMKGKYCVIVPIGFMVSSLSDRNSAGTQKLCFEKNLVKTFLELYDIGSLEI